MRFCLLFFLLATVSYAQYRTGVFAGSDSSGFKNGFSIEALFNKPFGMCIDKKGNIYLADTGNNCLRKIDSEGNVTTLAGSGKAGFEDGPAHKAEFFQPSGICTDNEGNFYIVDFLNQAIRKLDSNGYVSTIAGNGRAGYKDGFGKEAEFNYPRGIVLNSENEIFVSDSWNHRIRKISPGGEVTTFAGGGRSTIVNPEGENDPDYGTYKDGRDTTARFHTPCGLGIDTKNNIYVADALNHMVRKITPDGYVSTIAGNGLQGFTGGVSLESSLNTPTELYTVSENQILIADTYNGAVRYLSDEGNLLTIYSQEKPEVNFTRGIVCEIKEKNIFFIDYNRSKILKIEGVVLK